MIDEYWTFKFYGYYSDSLSKGSHKKIVVVCDKCYKYRISQMKNHYDICSSCGKKGKRNPFYHKHHTKESCRKLSESHIGLQSGENNPMFGVHISGDKHWNYGKHWSDEVKEKMKNKICNHHYIYDHKNPNKFIIKLSNSIHTKLHWLLRHNNIIIPHINITEKNKNIFKYLRSNND